MSLFDTRKKFPSQASHQECSGFLLLDLFFPSIFFNYERFFWDFFYPILLLVNVADKARISSWVAHQNAIFDICWIKVL